MDAAQVNIRNANTSDGRRRGRDRRGAFGDLLETLARAVASPGQTARARASFEDKLRQLLRVKTVHLRDRVPGGRQAAAVARRDAFAIDIPGASPGAGSMLEVLPGPGTELSEWDHQVLAMSAHLGTLLLELERRSCQPPRADATVVPPSRDGAAPLIGSTPAMADLRSRIERVAATDFTTLLEGESGVGKELVARQIHELSARRGGPFVAINCAALVETLLEAELFGIEERTATGVRGRRGKFEHADGGTLFLDEVSDLSLSAQAKLLRAIQDLAVERVGGQGVRRVDIRIIAATNRGLAGLVDRRLFRADLFYRLGGIDIRVPPLRERRPDIRELATYFLDRHRGGRPLRLSEGALHALTNHDWPGNVRELERLMERAVALTEGDVIEVDDLPPQVRGDYAEVLMPALRRGDTMRTWGARYARLVMDRCRGNKRETARTLGISYHTLISYLRTFDALSSGARAPLGTAVPLADPLERPCGAVHEDPPGSVDEVVDG